MKFNLSFFVIFLLASRIELVAQPKTESYQKINSWPVAPIVNNVNPDRGGSAYKVAEFSKWLSEKAQNKLFADAAEIQMRNMYGAVVERLNKAPDKGVLVTVPIIDTGLNSIVGNGYIVGSGYSPGQAFVDAAAIPSVKPAQPDGTAQQSVFVYYEKLNDQIKATVLDVHMLGLSAGTYNATKEHVSRPTPTPAPINPPPPAPSVTPSSSPHGGHETSRGPTGVSHQSATGSGSGSTKESAPGHESQGIENGGSHVLGKTNENN